MSNYSWIDEDNRLITKIVVSPRFIGMLVYCHHASYTEIAFLKHNPMITAKWEEVEPTHPDAIYLKTRMLIEGIPF